GEDELNTEPERIANSGRGDDAHWIRLRVAPDGKTYKVDVPSTGHEETFMTRDDEPPPESREPRERRRRRGRR
ncbi:MAG TPA: hypothetical protein VK116_20045, partial [Planctomycetota bacterium]|nr:hypothetical protein [Planctomycetota bacterium]